jgi:AbrB family looped-hinge helix DNA binding protein
MESFSTTKMSSKGQVVIPEKIRKQLHLKTGSQFIVIGENDVLILKSISKPTMSEFDELIKKARSQAQVTNLKPDDILDAVTKYRGRK